MTVVKVPAGGLAWPWSLPAPAGQRPVRGADPQLCSTPAVTAVKVPAGGLAWPWSLLPQHVSVPSVSMAQLWKAPAVTVVNVPVGGVACPKSLRPQQASETFVRSASCGGSLR